MSDRDELNPEQIRELLQERARKLAARGGAGAVSKLFARVIVVRRGESWWGLPTENLVEVRRVKVVAVPHATPAIPGLFQVRGQVYGLIDAAPLLGLPSTGDGADETLAAIVTSARGILGIRVDQVLGSRAVHEDELQPALRERQPDFVSGVTADLLTLLDPQLLFERPEFILDLLPDT